MSRSAASRPRPRVERLVRWRRLDLTTHDVVRHGTVLIDRRSRIRLERSRKRERESGVECHR
jgi:hypothetical protein